MKKVLLFSLFLFVVCGVLLTVQWIGYEKLSSASGNIVSTQLLELDIKKNEIEVKQTLYSIPDGTTVKVIFPADAREISCADGTDCEVEGQSASLTASGGVSTVQYKLPALPGGQAFVLPNWQAVVENVDVTKTELLVTDHSKKGGQWISSLAQTANEQLSMIDFYSFKGEGHQAPLFWQKSPLKKSEFSGMTVFSSEPIRVPEQSISFPFSKDEMVSQTVIITGSVKPRQLDGLTIIGKESELRGIRTAVITQYAEKHFIFPEEEKWLASFVAVALYDAQPMYMKAARLDERMMSALTESEQEKWKQMLFSFKGKEVTAEKLDEALSAVKGEQTDFFQRNNGANTPDAPLVFFDGRPVTVEGEPASFHLKKKDGLLYVPLKEAVSSLGYTASTVSGGEILLKKEFETFRVNINEKRVLLNEHQYALYETALQEIDGTLYIDKIWFQKLFLVEVVERDEAIDLASYGI